MSFGLPGPVVLAAVGTDLERQRPAIELAVHEAETRGVAVVVLHACGGSHGPLPVGSPDAFQLRHTRYVVGLAGHGVRRLCRPGTLVHGLHSTLDPVAALVVASQSASLVVLQGSAGGGRFAAVPARTVQAVVERAGCPVAVLHGADAGETRGAVVVGVAGSLRGQTCVRAAAGEALRRDAPLVAVHAYAVGSGSRVPPSRKDLADASDAAERLLAHALEGLAADFPAVEVHQHVVRGPAADVLRSFARTASIVVLARRECSSVGLHSLGRTAQALLDAASCPVVLTPPYGSPYRFDDPGLADVLLNRVG